MYSMVSDGVCIIDCKWDGLIATCDGDCDHCKEYIEMMADLENEDEQVEIYDGRYDWYFPFMEWDAEFISLIKAWEQTGDARCIEQAWNLSQWGFRKYGG